MTTETNPEVLAVCYAQGWCETPNYMTYGEAQAVTDISTAFSENTNIAHFEEFQYFGATSIPNNAFYGCTSLVKIGIPPSIQSVGTSCFYGTRINEVYITDIAKYINAFYLYDTSWTRQPAVTFYSKLFLNNIRVYDLVIPEGITSIGISFRYMSFNSVKLPTSLTYIIYRAFGNCGISDVIIKADSIAEFIERGIGINQYNDSDPRVVASRVFINDTELTGSFNIPSEVTKIGDCAFRGCKNITAITIPNTVTSIGSSAFQAVVNLTSLIIPNSVLTNGYYTLQGCTNLTMLDCGTNFNPFNNYNTAGGCRNLSVIKMRATTAPSIDVRQNNIGDLVEGTKYLYVPANSTGYDTGNWATLCNNLGFTLSKTL